MTEDEIEEKPVQTKKQKTKEDKQVEHIDRIKRTLVACFMGIFTGAISYFAGGAVAANGIQSEAGLLGFMLMLAGIVVQKHIFMISGMDTSKLGGKDWFYQGFMTFAFWFMTWTILLSATVH